VGQFENLALRFHVFEYDLGWDIRLYNEFDADSSRLYRV
jgi:hypothetical protein